MVDRVQEMQKRLQALEEMDDGDAIRAMQRRAEAAAEEEEEGGKKKRRQDNGDLEVQGPVNREQVMARLKGILGKLEVSQFEEMAPDLRRWLLQTESHEGLLRELLTSSAEQEQDVLGLLTLSRYLIEESISMHLVSGAKALAGFHGKLDKHITAYQHFVREVKCGRDAKKMRDDERADTSFLELKKKELKAFVFTLGEMRERHGRQMEQNRSMYGTMMTKMSSQGASGADSQATGIIRAGGSAAKTEEPGAEAHGEMDDASPVARSESSRGKWSFVAGSVRAKYPVHIEAVVARSIQQARIHSEDIERLATERVRLLNKLRRLMRKSGLTAPGASAVGGSSGNPGAAQATAASHSLRDFPADRDKEPSLEAWAAKKEALQSWLAEVTLKCEAYREASTQMHEVLSKHICNYIYIYIYIYTHTLSLSLSIYIYISLYIYIYIYI